MLVRNPLTTYLYEFGYNGIENIYDYWLGNKNLILLAYNGRRRAKASDLQDLLAFKYKIRWASHIGQFLRLAMDRRIREHQGDKFLEFDSILLKRHFKTRSLSAFSQASFGKDALVTYTDLRGLSLLSRTVTASTLDAIDFSYGSLDGCEFNGVHFKNCVFNNTSFRHCRLINCMFDQRCVFTNNDFSNAYIDAHFNSPIEEPTISYLTRLSYLNLRLGHESHYLTYSHIISPSFVHCCSDKKISAYVTSFQKSSLWHQ